MKFTAPVITIELVLRLLHKKKRITYSFVYMCHPLYDYVTGLI